MPFGRTRISRQATHKANIRLEGSPLTGMEAAEPAVNINEAAEKAKAAKRTMQDAVHVAKKGEPGLKDAVRRGHVAVNTAAKVADLPPEERREVVTQAKSKKEIAKAAKKAAASKPKPKPNQTVAPGRRWTANPSQVAQISAGPPSQTPLDQGTDDAPPRFLENLFETFGRNCGPLSRTICRPFVNSGFGKSWRRNWVPSGTRFFSIKRNWVLLGTRFFWTTAFGHSNRFFLLRHHLSETTFGATLRRPPVARK
jgi:hypothetical protein